MSDALPRRDHELVELAGVIAQQVRSDPEFYAVSEARAEAFAVLQSRFAAALRTSLDPKTRTSSAVTAKNDARAAMESELRRLVKTIRSISQATDAQLVGMGLRPRTRSYVRAVLPTNPPALRVYYAQGWTIRLQVFDPEAEHRRARPKSVQTIHVFSTIGEPTNLNPAMWPTVGSFGKTKIALHFPHTVPLGTPVYLAARWLSTRCEASPPGQPVRVLLGGGGAQAQLAA